MTNNEIFFFTGLVIVLLLASLALMEVKQDYAKRKKLSAASVISVWLLYGFHAFTVFFASYTSLWTFPINSTLAKVLPIFIIRNALFDSSGSGF